MTEGQIPIQQFTAQVEQQVLRLLPELTTNLVSGKNPGFVVALSGGSDSTSLLMAMSSVCHKYAWQLMAAHINHGTRGTDSDADEAFCLRLCNRLNIEFGSTKLKLSVDEDPAAHISEEQLRDARYKELIEMAKQWDADYILFGHTFDDQTETMLFHLFRGTGLTGLRGMPPRRHLLDSISLLRPLTNIRRADCRRFLQELGQDWVEDSSNQQDFYSRNYIRQHIIPVIEKRFPKFQDCAVNLRQIAGEAEEYLEASAAEIQDEIQLVLSEQESRHLSANDADICEIWDITTFQSQMPALRKQLITGMFKKHGIMITTKRMQNLYDLLTGMPDTADGAINLSSELRVRVHLDYIIWEELGDDSPALAVDALTVAVPGITPFPALNKLLNIKIRSQVDEFPQSAATQVIADFTNAVFPLVIRTREAGDIIQPLGMKERVRLKKFIHTRKLHLSSAQRANLAVLADQNEVLWIPGVGMSEKIRVKSGGCAYHLYWSDIASENVLNTSAGQQFLA